MIEWRRRLVACHDPRMTPQELFRLHPLFSALTEGETRELLKRALTKRIAAGEVVFRKDDPGDGLYGVLTGSVLIVVELPEGKELVLNKHDAGELFGEVALLDGEGRSAGAIAHEASELLFLGRDKFLAFLRPRPQTMIRIIALLCARLRRATNLFEDSAFLNVPTRLAKQIIALIEGYRPREELRASSDRQHLAKGTGPDAGGLARVRQQATRRLARGRHHRPGPSPPDRPRRTRARAAHCRGPTSVWR